jgi:hypothetical protein
MESKMFHHDGLMYALSGAAVGTAAAAHSPLQLANEIGQLVLTLVGIASGIASLIYYLSNRKRKK